MINRLIEIAIRPTPLVLTITTVNRKEKFMKIEVNQIKTNKKNIEVHIIPTEDMRYEEI